jgi:hypothetical protein
MRDEKYVRAQAPRPPTNDITSVTSSIISQVPDGKTDHSFTFGVLDAGPFESRPEAVSDQLLKSGAARVSRHGDGRPAHLCFAGDVVVEVKLEVCTKDVRA